MLSLLSHGSYELWPKRLVILHSRVYFVDAHRRDASTRYKFNKYLIPGGVLLQLLRRDE